MPLQNKRVVFEDLGLLDYKTCWDYQEELFNNTIAQKIANRNLKPEEQVPTKNYLLFVEHPHVYTLGKSGNEKNLLLNQQQLSQNNATYYKINRGGDITYHGPGQLVAYPILDLDNLSLAFPTGVDQKSIGTSFLVFPNPATSELNIISKDKNAASVIILDVNGRVVDEIFLENEKTRIDLEKYSSGVYSYSIESKSKAKLLSNKFIITK